jgi:hypothetical protein
LAAKHLHEHARATPRILRSCNVDAIRHIVSERAGVREV